VYARPGPPPDDRTVLISIISRDGDARAHTYATINEKKAMVESNHIILNANKSNAIVPDPTDKPRISPIRNNKAIVYIYAVIVMRGCDGGGVSLENFPPLLYIYYYYKF